MLTPPESMSALRSIDRVGSWWDAVFLARRRCATFHPKWGVSQRNPPLAPLTLLPVFAPRIAEKRIGRTDPVIQPGRQ